MRTPREKLSFDKLYHICNYAVGNEMLFRESRNYQFFLDRIEKWIQPVADIHVYSLLADHFHLIIRINSASTIASHFQVELGRFLYTTDFVQEVTEELEFDFLEKLLVQQFKNCFSSYATGFNKTYNRQGALFRESFRRTQILTGDQFKKLVKSIYMEPFKSGIVAKPELWKYSNYSELIGGNSSFCKGDEIISLFGSANELKKIARWDEEDVPELHYL